MCSLLDLIDFERIMSNVNLHLITAPLLLALFWSWTKSLGRTMDIVITVFSWWFIPIVITITELYAHHAGVVDRFDNSLPGILGVFGYCNYSCDTRRPGI